MELLGEKIYNHYSRFLGDCSFIKKFSGENFKTQIFFYKELIEGCDCFATFGLSRYQNYNFQCEVFCMVDCDSERALDVFGEALVNAIQNNMLLIRGSVIDGVENIDSIFSNTHNISGIYFTECFIGPDDFKTVEGECEILLAFFISSEEIKYINENGFEAYEAKLEICETDVFALNR